MKEVEKGRSLSTPVGADEGKADGPLSRAVAALRPYRRLHGTSQLVVNEASAGDAESAADRLKLLAGLPLVPITDEVRQIAEALLSASLMSVKAAADALYVAAAAFAGVDYLLTQNCGHIANAHILPRIYAILAELGYGGLLICTPAEFLGGLYDDK